MILRPLGYVAEEMLYRATYFLTLLQFKMQAQPVRTLLVNGSPKTGTTWMLEMLAAMPNYNKAGNYNGKIRRYRTAIPGNVIHGHDFWTPEMRASLAPKDIRTVLMYRDPRDQAVSRMFHIRREKRHTWRKKFLEMDNDSALMACIEGDPAGRLPGIREMTRLTKSWQSPDTGAVLLRYEDLVDDTFGQMQRVLDHFEIRIPQALLKNIIARKRFERMTVGRNIFKPGRRKGQSDASSHFRKGIKGDWRNHFNPEHIRRTKELVGETLIEWGYERGMDW